MGGGLRDAFAVECALNAGAERVVIGTAALADPEFLEDMLDEHGQRVVVGVDARGGMAATQGWTETSGEAAPALIRDLAERGVSRIVWTPIEVDGTMEGPPLHQLSRDRRRARRRAHLLGRRGLPRKTSRRSPLRSFRRWAESSSAEPFMRAASTSRTRSTHSGFERPSGWVKVAALIRRFDFRRPKSPAPALNWPLAS